MYGKVDRGGRKIYDERLWRKSTKRDVLVRRAAWGEKVVIVFQD